MFIETLDGERRSAVFASFFVETTAALIAVFDKSEHEAREAVRALSQRFADAPTSEQNFLLHNDPVALACELAEVPWAQVDKHRLDRFNDLRRQSPPIKP